MNWMRSARVALLACAGVASLGLLVGPATASAKKVKKRTVTRTATFNQCVSLATPIPDRGANTTTPGVAYASAVLPVTVPNFKGAAQDGVVTAFTTAGVRITHTFDADLDLFLVSPGGKVVDLANNRGLDGDGYGTGATSCAGSLVLFGDTFGTSIVTPGNTGQNPITGSFKPEQPLSTFQGGPARGNWVLIAVDTANADTGTLNAFSLNFTYNFLAQVKAKKKK
jgi:subtilisin-like proprotein convertase family protein